MRSITAGDRFWKDINGIPVRDLGAPTPLGGEPPGPPEAIPATQVLARTGIPLSTYQTIRGGLLRAGYLSVAVQPEYLYFVKDGFLADEYGVLWVRPGHEPPRAGLAASPYHPRFGSVRPLGDGWYAFDASY